MCWKAFTLFLFILLLFFDIAFSKTKKGSAKNKNIQERRGMEKTRQTQNPECECGRLGTYNDPTDLIVGGGGSIVKPLYKYPWIIAIYVYNRLLCGASIITQNYVLTAGHCVILTMYAAVDQGVYDPKLCKQVGIETYCSIPFNALKLRFNAEEDRLKNAIDVRSIILPPKFNGSFLQYDVAILRTSAKLPCDKFTAPICLPTLPGLSCVGADATAIGWGQSKLNDPRLPTPSEAVLREAKLKLHRSEDCDVIRMAMSHLCASGDNQNTCHGDSGGPLFQQVDGKNYLIGITSFGDKKNNLSVDCDYTLPAFYTDVKLYLTWISDTIGRKSPTKKKKGKKCFKE